VEKLVAAGDIYLGKYAGWYSVRDETYFVESETELGADGKRRAVSTGADVDWVEEPSYFFRLSPGANGCSTSTPRTRASSRRRAGATRS
jgi:methionyl-tRNA synthetase